ncbi:Hemolysin_III family protein [Hexamita inflata]|uniref:Hemolysin III family protein n=1 Tax=Hexamita inflata TaxID=28002 RepID=A0AA86QFV5_9EUKA|nr:Hemolysin III family protein [Hexamita inflata]
MLIAQTHMKMKNYDENSDTSESQEVNFHENGFASKFDPDFSKMSRKELSLWIRNKNYAPDAVTNELFNIWSHLLGGVACVSGAAYMFMKSDSVTKKISFVLYGISLGIMLFGSALYHYFGLRSGISINLYRIFRLVDHQGIFFAIAGSTVPFALVIVGGALGWAVTVYMYFILTCGVCMKMVLRHSVSQSIFNWMYLLMGWSPCILIHTMLQKVGSQVVWFTFWGGVSYSVGLIVFAKQKPNLIPGIFCSHEIWHVFVLAGVLLHLWAHVKYTFRY